MSSSFHKFLFLLRNYNLIRLSNFWGALQSVDDLHSSVEFKQNVLDRFRGVWSQQLIHWRRQLQNFPGGLDFRLGGFGILAKPRVECLLFLLTKDFPEIYNRFVKSLYGFLMCCSVDHFEKAVGLIPPWPVLTSKQKDKFVEILRRRFENLSLVYEPFLERIMKHLVENFPQMVSTRLAEIFLNPRFNFPYTNIHNIFSDEQGLSNHNPISCNHIPIEVILNADDESTGRKYEVLVVRFIRNNVRLYLLGKGRTSIGCWIEDNKETRISYEHFCELQRRILIYHPLRAYIASYQAKPSSIDNVVNPSTSIRDLTFFNRWLKQELGSGWEIGLRENGEQLLITRKDRSLTHLRSARQILEDLTDAFMFKLDSKEVRLVVQGTSKEINQFLDRLEEEYNTSRPASSVSPEATSSSCVMS